MFASGHVVTCQFYKFIVILIKVSTQSGPTHTGEQTTEAFEKDAHALPFRRKKTRVSLCASSSATKLRSGKRVVGVSRGTGVGLSCGQACLKTTECRGEKA